MIITCLFLQDSIEKLPRNVMWSPLEAQLFTSLDVSTGEIEGFDRNVLADLIKLYLLKPTVSQEVGFRV